MSNFIRKSRELAPLIATATSLALGTTACSASQEPGTKGKIVEVNYPAGDNPGSRLAGYRFESKALIGTETAVMVCDMTYHQGAAESGDSPLGSQKKVTIKPGDTIWKILGDPSDKNNPNYPKLMSAYADDVTPEKDVIAGFVAEYNNVDPAKLQPGTEITLPSTCDIPQRGRATVIEK